MTCLSLIINVFMNVMALSWAYNPKDIAEVLNRLGDDYVPLTLPQFSALWRQQHPAGETE